MFFNICVKGQVSLLLGKMVIFPLTVGMSFPSSWNEAYNLKCHAGEKRDVALASHLQHPSQSFMWKYTKCADGTNRTAKRASPFLVLPRPSALHLPNPSVLHFAGSLFGIISSTIC